VRVTLFLLVRAESARASKLRAAIRAAAGAALLMEKLSCHTSPRNLRRAAPFYGNVTKTADAKRASVSAAFAALEPLELS
jgi:hypothetical protein